MDTTKIGQFIAALRKSSGLTQQDVADSLGITDKTVSKWECGKGLPDITALPAIAELFGVTTDEILRGERIIETEKAEQTQKKTIEQAEFFIENKCRRIKNLLYIALGGALSGFVVLYVLSSTTYSGPISCGVSLILCIVSAIIAFYAFSEIKGTKRNKAVLLYNEGTSLTNIDAVMRFTIITIFIVFYVVVLNISLLMLSAQHGGDLPQIDRDNLFHHIVAVVIAGIGAFICSRSSKK